MKFHPFYVGDKPPREDMHIGCQGHDAGDDGNNVAVVVFTLSPHLTVIRRSRPGDVWGILGAAGGLSGVLLLALKVASAPFRSVGSRVEAAASPG